MFFKVVKNTLVSRAVDGTEYECVKDALKGPLLYAFSNEDPGAAGRSDQGIRQGQRKLKAKLVAIGGKAYPAVACRGAGFAADRDQALAMLPSVLVQPATMLVARAFKAVAQSGGGDEAAAPVEAEAAA